MKVLFKKIRLFCIVSLLLQPMQMVEANKAAKTDFITLAAMMIQDGHYDRALLALQSVNLEDEETDFMRFYTLQGLAFLHLKDMQGAVDSLTTAVQKGQQDPTIQVYLAQAHYGLKNYRQVIKAINRAGDIINKYPLLWEMKAQSYWHLKQHDQAINVLDQAQKVYPSDFRYLRRKLFYFVELGLFQQAAILGQQYLALSDAGEKDFIAIGNALRMSKQYQKTLQIMETARLKYPANITVAKVLAHTYIDMGQLNSGAYILEQASLYDASLLSEAAEVYRRAGRLYKALTLNASIRDRKVKLKQRLSILIALKRYDRAANMKSNLYRAGLLEDQNIRYALAYAYFASGQHEAASRQIDYLKDSEVFKKGVELRRVMESCKAEPWQCA